MMEHRTSRRWISVLITTTLVLIYVNPSGQAGNALNLDEDKPSIRPLAQTGLAGQISVLDQPFLMNRLPPEKFSVAIQYEYAQVAMYRRHECEKSIQVLYSSVRLLGRHTIEINIPYSREKAKSSLKAEYPYRGDEGGLENIKIAYLYGPFGFGKELQNIISLGLYLPTTGEEGSAYYNNWYEMLYYMEDLIFLPPFWCSYIVISQVSLFTLSAEIGADFAFNDGDCPPLSDDLEEFAHYGVGVSVKPIDSLALKLELVGLARLSRFKASEYGLEFDQLQHQALMGARYRYNRITLGAFYQTYLNNLRDVVDPGVGLEAMVSF